MPPLSTCCCLTNARGPWGAATCYKISVAKLGRQHSAQTIERMRQAHLARHARRRELVARAAAEQLQASRGAPARPGRRDAAREDADGFVLEQAVSELIGLRREVRKCSTPTGHAMLKCIPEELMPGVPGPGTRMTGMAAGCINQLRGSALDRPGRQSMRMSVWGCE